MDNIPYTNSSNKITFTKRRRLIIYNLLYKITYSHTPTTFLFLISFIFKFWGTFLISHLREQKIQVNSLSEINFVSFLRKFTFSQFFETNNHLNPTIYTSLCIIIYLIFSINIILSIISANLIFNKTIENKRKRNIICWCLCVINVYCMFLLQHIIEILYVIIFGLCENNDKSNIGVFMNSFGIGKYVLAILNFLFIIIANVQSHVFIILQNKPFLNSKYPLKFYIETPLFYLLLSILYNFQGIQFITFIYSSKTVIRSILFAQIIILIVIIITYFNNYQDDGSFIAKWFSVILLICGYSSIINIFLPESISISFHIESILLEIFASIITDYLIKKAIYRYRRTKIRDMIFIAHKRRGRADVYLTVVLFLKQFITNISRQEELYDIIEEHKEHCKAKKCLCCLFENVMTVLSKEKDKLDEDSHFKIFLHLNSELIAVLGKEISLLYEQIIRENSITRLKQITLLYVDFTFFFMSNINSGCFIVDKTLTKLHLKNKCGLFFGFMLFKLKKENIKAYKKRLIINGNDLKIQTKGYFCANRIINFWNIYKYQNIIFHLMRLIEKTTQKLEKVINYGFVKYIAESQSFNSTPQKNYLEEVLKFNSIYDTVYTFYKSHKLLISHLKLNFSKENKLLNLKACYLTSLYFKTVCNEIPKDIISILSDDNFNNLLDNSQYSFPETGFHYPFIINHNCEKNLSLLYICPLLAKKLGYKKSDVIEQDIKKFLPKLFWAPHQFIVQRILFNTNIKPICIDMFILNKNGNYVPCVCDFCYFPTLNRGLIIIMDIQLKTNEHNTTYFVLDKFCNFITFSQNAEMNFYLNDEIIAENKFNFLNFFGLNQSLFHDFKDNIHDIENRNVSFSSNNKIETFKKNYTYKTKEFIYDKSKLKETFEKIQFHLQDSQTYFDIYKKLNTMDILFSSFVEIDPSMFSNIKQYYSIIKHQLLLFQISLRKVDVLPFFVVKVSHILPTYHFKHETCIYISSMKKQNKNLHKSGSLLIVNNHTKKKSTMSILDNSKQKSSFFVLKNSNTPMLTHSNSKDKSQELNVSVDIISNSEKDNSTTQGIWSSTQNNILDDKKSDDNVNNIVQNKYLSWKELMILYKKIKTGKRTRRLSIFLPTFSLFFFILFHLFCLCFISNYISRSQELFQLTHSVRTLEYMVILVSATFLDGCISTTYPDKTKNVFSEKLFEHLIHDRAQDMLNYLTLFQIGLSRMKLDSISKQFEIEETYFLLQDDWSIKPKNVTLRDIILLYHYYLNSIGKTITINKCNVYNYKIDNNQLQTLIIDKPNILDKLYVFILKNILGRIYCRITQTYNQINEVANKEYSSVLLRGIINNTMLFIFCVILLVLFLMLINHYVLLIIRIIELLISKKDHDVLYEKIKIFKSIAQDLCLHKEHKLKLSLDPIFYLSSTQREKVNTNEDKQNQCSLSSANVTTSFDGSGLGLLVMKVPNNRALYTNSLSKKQKHEDHNQNKKRMSKIIIDDDIFEYKTKSNDTDKNKDDSTSNMKNVISTSTSSKETIKKKKIIYSKYIKSSFTILTLIYFWGVVVLVIETCIIIYSIFFLIQKSSHEKKSAIFGMNIVEKGNFYILLELSYKISILYFDPYLKDQFQLIYDNVIFNETYIDENRISSYDHKFNSTFFGLFYELTRQSTRKVQTLKIDSNHFDIFKVLRYKNDQFETANFCFFIVKYYFQLETAEITSFEDFLIKSNLSLRDCRKTGEGINDNGISTALESTFLHLTNNYVDFMKDYQSKNRNQIERYLTDVITIKMIHNLEYNIDKAHIIKIIEIKKEIVYNYISWKNSELFFIIVFLLFEIISLFSGSLFIRKLIVYYKVLYEVTGYIFNSLKK